MKKIYFLWYILLVIGIVAAFDFIFSVSVEKLTGGNYVPKASAAIKSDSKLAVIGASRAAHHYIPSMLEDSLNISSFNYGIDGRNIFVHYVILESLVNSSQQKPEIVILDIGQMDVEEMPTWGTERLNIFYPYYNSDSRVRTTLNDLLDTPELLSLQSSGLLRHNSEIITYIKNIVRKENEIKDHGYVPLYNAWTEDLKVIEQPDNQKVDPKKVEYLEKFISLCKDENISLLIVSSPAYIKRDTKPKWISTVRSITEKEGIPFLEYQDNALFLSHKEWFNDEYHLNDTGARQFTRLLIPEISSLLSGGGKGGA